MTADEGRGFIYLPLLNYADGNLDFVEGLLRREDAIPSLSDGGAHCGTICDAASPTYLLQHWVRDRARGRVPIELAIKRQCRDTAMLYGLQDRGLVAAGMLADLNVIDLDRLKLGKPWMAFDLPAGGKRLLQTADGYVATIKSGVVTFRGGEATGARRAASCADRRRRRCGWRRSSSGVGPEPSSIAWARVKGLVSGKDARGRAIWSAASVSASR